MDKQTVLSSFGQGFSEGYATAQSRNHQLELQMRGLLRELKECKQDLFLEAAADISSTVQQICWNLLRKHLAVHPEDIASVLSETLEHKSGRQVVIAMHPSMAERARPFLDETICKVETDATIVPGDFEVHIQETKRSLAEIIGIQVKANKANP